MRVKKKNRAKFPLKACLRRFLPQSFLALLFSLAWSGPIAAEVVAPDPVGLWWVSHGDGEPLQFRLYPDGTAWSDYPENNPGRWEKDGENVLCLWADDWKEVLVWSGQDWQKQGFAPGQSLDSPPSNFSRAQLVSPRPDGWFGQGPR